MKITLGEMVSRCAENGLMYTVVEIGTQARALVLERGGRIFGPFYGDQPGLLWANPVWSDQDAFRQFLESMDWNLGGDRVWIAPEIQFNVKDRTKFWETIATPPEVDPGSCRMEASKSNCVLRQQMTLPAYNLARGTVRLSLEKCIYAAANPLRTLTGCAWLMDGVAYSGYVQGITLMQQEGGGICAEAWNVSQVTPEGDILIPTVPNAEYVDYYEPVDAQCFQRQDHCLRLKASGNRRYKIGLKSAHVFGKIAYLGTVDGQPYLFIKQFFNNPSAGYAEEPWHSPGVCGFSTHIYNDDGNMGGFAELECNLQTIGGDTNRRASQDIVCNWFFQGERGKLRHILTALTGISVF